MFSDRTRLYIAVSLLSLAVASGGCSAARPVEPGAPAERAADSRYPLRLSASENRRERTVAVWRRLNAAQNTAAGAPELHPVTGAVTALPPAASSSAPAALSLPRIGPPAAPFASDDETREALRRFLLSSAELLAAEPTQVSLLEITGAAGETRIARYAQRPFLYPLRNGYGVIEIEFAPDGRVTRLYSTAIPADEQLRRAVAGLAPRLTPDEINRAVVDQTYTFADQAGQASAVVAVAPSDKIILRELVIFPLLRRRTEDQEAQLELHLAWEAAVGPDGSVRDFYIDAISGEVLNAAASE